MSYINFPLLNVVDFLFSAIFNRNLRKFTIN